LLPYYARHDIKHILLDYDTKNEGEGCLQCFMLGNGHVSFPVVATVLYGWATMPEHWPASEKHTAEANNPML
jgi:ubiquinone biosynthesis protein Coq4